MNYDLNQFEIIYISDIYLDFGYFTKNGKIIIICCLHRNNTETFLKSYYSELSNEY